MEMTLLIKADEQLLGALQAIADGLKFCGTPVDGGSMIAQKTEQPVEKKTAKKAKKAEGPMAAVEAPKAEEPTVAVEAPKTKEPTVTVEAPSAVINYTIEQIGRMGAQLFDAKIIGPEYFSDVLKGKPLNAMSQDELNAVAADMMSRGGVVNA